MTDAPRVTPPAGRSVPELLGGAALVALVPASDDLARAAAAAWAFARHVAATGRRVALVDCYVDTPTLHLAGGQPNGDGIVDVFEYGASLSHIARPQPEPSLFFVPAGTLSAEPVAMMGNPRWKRLAAGFRHEDAVMLLFQPPETIGAIAADLDALVALAPDGFEAGLAATPEIQAAVDAGLRLVAAVTDEGGIQALPEDGHASPPPAVPAAAGAEDVAPVEEVVPAAEAPPAGDVSGPAAPLPEPVPAAPALRRPMWRPMPAPTAPSARGRWLVLGFVAIALAGGGIAAYERLRPHGALQGPLPPVASPAPAPLAKPAAEAPAARPAAPAAAPAAPTARRADSLPYAVQASAWTHLSQAVAARDRLTARRLPSLIAPIRIGARLWYRVYAGPAASRRGADSLLASLRAAGLDAGRSAIVALVPLSFSLGRFPSEAAARAAAGRLAARGVPAFVLGRADGAAGLWAGAYATAAQADALRHLLTSTGSAGPLAPRVGTQP